jgi:hypothetical protein
MSFKSFLRRILRKELTSSKFTPSISRECMTAMAENSSIAGPYYSSPSFREYARDFLEKYRDGDYRTKFGMPEMTVAELTVLGQAAGGQ